VAGVSLLGVAALAAFLANRDGRDRDRADQPPPAPAEKGQPAPPPAPQAGFVIVGATETYPGLAEAIAAARDDQVIEVRGDGPFRTPPVPTRGKKLAVRAAPGSRPVIIPETPTRPQDGPLIRADADLHLEGLDIRWPIEVRQGPSEANLLSHCAVANTRGRLTLTRCRVETGEWNFAVGASGRELVVQNCFFPTRDGIGIFWRPEPGGRASAEGCQFETDIGFLIPTTPETDDRTTASLLLAGNTFIGGDAVRLRLDMKRRQLLKVTARRNIFDINHVMMLLAPLGVKAPELTRPKGMTDFAQSFVGWSDEANVYRRGGKYLVTATLKSPVFSAGIARPTDWAGVWGQPATDSVEGVIRYRERAKSSLPQPLRVDRIDDLSGELPAGAGADPDRVGPQ
jgi:hypothetical protein